ncbi:MAG TPA: hypothetical protein VJV75_04455, partial [Candidatus Polarisedimenticolia bacterium]|nr:hypothetical protein [Candidatus Polarisedimenticolia bacterium]
MPSRRSGGAAAFAVLFPGFDGVADFRPGDFPPRAAGAEASEVDWATSAGVAAAWSGAAADAPCDPAGGVGVGCGRRVFAGSAGAGRTP